ncbi:MAG: ABC transporter permease [Bacteroidales bacterium]|nr:ABC transporter permease [Bacteroidales bacterium]
MSKISLIINREYFSRIKKKSFIIMTIIGPLLLAALFIVPIWLQKIAGEDSKLIAVIDQQNMFNSSALNHNANSKTDSIFTLMDLSRQVLPFDEKYSEDSVAGIFEALNYFIAKIDDFEVFFNPEKVTGVLDQLKIKVLDTYSKNIPADSLKKLFSEQYIEAYDIIAENCIKRDKFFVNMIPDSRFYKFVFLRDVNKDTLLAELKTGESKYDAVLEIPETFYNKNFSGVQMYSKDEIHTGLQNYVRLSMEKEVERMILISEKVDIEVLNKARKNFTVGFSVMQDDGFSESQAELKQMIGFIAGFLIYIFIFMYGVQVMRGVIEEKTSRIVEIIVSSVKPYQLMMGKIVGIAMVGLTQFLLWVLLTFAIISGLKSYLSEPAVISDQQIAQQEQLMNTPGVNGVNMDQSMQMPTAEQSILDQIESLSDIVFGYVILLFIFFFVFGYLLYASLFAAVGSAVDAETDTQQFMMPITIPIILSIISIPVIVQNPDGPVAFWLSIIPFTSPIAMMARIPYEIPVSEIILSMSLLLITFLFVAWLSARIYRTGILMYGKKVSYKELWKWLKYKG